MSESMGPSACAESQQLGHPRAWAASQFVQCMYWNPRLIEFASQCAEWEPSIIGEGDGEGEGEGECLGNAEKYMETQKTVENKSNS